MRTRPQDVKPGTLVRSMDGPAFDTFALPPGAPRTDEFSLTTREDAPEQPPAPAPVPAKAKARTFDPVLQQRFKDLVKDRGYSLSKLEKMMGRSSSAISKYLNGKPEGKVIDLERLVADLLMKEMRGLLISDGGDGLIFETDLTTTFANLCMRCEKHRYLGSFIGEPGLGKSKAAELYVQRHPLSIYVELSGLEGGGTPSALVRRIMESVDTHSYDEYRQTKGEWIRDHFRDSGRLVLLDNSNLLTKNGLEWVLSFNDKTHCGLVMIANSELKRTVHQVQRAPSRIGAHREVAIAEAKHREIAKSLLEQHWKDASSTLLNHATRLISERGALRACAYAIQTARELNQEHGNSKLPPLQAFEAAIGLQARFNKPKRLN